MALGTTSSSALVRSAASISTQILDYQDKLAAQQWNDSAQTAGDYQQYQNYLNGRITTLSSLGGISNASKALTLNGTLTAAQRSFTSNETQRAQQNIMEGNGTSSDKLQQIGHLYDNAVSSGDYNLAQNLRSQWDSLSQQVQYDQHTAATAGTALAKSQATAQQQGFADINTAIDHNLALITKDLNETGQGNLTAQEKTATDNIRSLAKSAGITIPAGSNLSSGSLIQAAFNTKIAMYGAMAQVAQGMPNGTSAYNSAGWNEFSLQNNLAQIHFGGYDFTKQEADDFAANPHAMVAINDSGGTRYIPAAVTGISYGPDGSIQKQYSTTLDTKSGKSVANSDLSDTNPSGVATSKTNRDTLAKQLQDSGFTVNKIDPTTGRVFVSLSTNQKNSQIVDWAKQNGLDLGTNFELIKTNSGYQMALPGAKGELGAIPITNSSGHQILPTLFQDGSGFHVFNSSYNTVSGLINYASSLKTPIQIGLAASQTGPLNVTQAKTYNAPLPVHQATANSAPLVAKQATTPTAPLKVVQAQPQQTLKVSSAPLTVAQPKTQQNLSVGQAQNSGGLLTVK